MKKHLIIAEYIGDETKIGFVVGYADTDEETEEAVKYLYEAAMKCDSYEIEYLRQQNFRSYPIHGEDYIVTNGTCTTNGSLSVFSVKLRGNNTANEFIRERQFKTAIFTHEQMEKLVDGYGFHELPCIN